MESWLREVDVHLFEMHPFLCVAYLPGNPWQGWWTAGWSPAQAARFALWLEGETVEEYAA